MPGVIEYAALTRVACVGHALDDAVFEIVVDVLGFGPMALVIAGIENGDTHSLAVA